MCAGWRQRRATDNPRYRGAFRPRPCQHKQTDPSLRFLFNRLAHPATDFGGILIHRKRHVALEALRPGDDYTYIAAEEIGYNPGFVGRVEVLPAGCYRRFDAFTPDRRDSFAVEYG